eukprot:SAG31_NODE_2455_length_5664_cov_1.921294_1_plen_116_part_00
MTAYANGVRLGHHVGYLHALEWDVTAAVDVGSLAVVLAVDSFHNMTIDPLIGSFDMGEMPGLNSPQGAPPGPVLKGMSGPWGGIWGHVALEWRHPTWLAEVFIINSNKRLQCLLL